MNESEWDELNKVPFNAVRGLVVEGNATDYATAFLERCVAPLRVAVYNADDSTLQALTKYQTKVRVGPTCAPQKPQLTIVTPQHRFSFDGTLTSKKEEPRWFEDLYLNLVPFDGDSLASSLAATTPARRDFLAWFIRSGEMPPPNVFSFTLLAVFPSLRNKFLLVGCLVAAFGLTQPGVLFEGIGGVGLLIGAALQLEIGELQKRFGKRS